MRNICLLNNGNTRLPTLCGGEAPDEKLKINELEPNKGAIVTIHTMHHHTHSKTVQATYCIHQLFSFLVFFWIEHVIAEVCVEICIKKYCFYLEHTQATSRERQSLSI